MWQPLQKKNSVQQPLSQEKKKPHEKKNPRILVVRLPLRGVLTYLFSRNILQDLKKNLCLLYYVKHILGFSCEKGLVQFFFPRNIFQKQTSVCCASNSFWTNPARRVSKHLPKIIFLKKNLCLLCV